MVQLLRQYDTLLKDNIETATLFNATSSAIQNDSIQSIHDVVLDEITIQILVLYLFLLCRMRLQMLKVSQLSTVLKYAHEGKFEERFVGFTDVSINRCSDGLFNHAQSVISKLNLKSKLVAETYYGASVMNGDLQGLQAKLLEICPHAPHVHCYKHIQSCSASEP